MTLSDKASRLQEEIDRNLRRSYDEVLKEDVPERFTRLLNELRSREAASGDEGKGDGPR